MKIIAHCFIDGKDYFFDGLEDAEKKTRISWKRILNCIETGKRWRCWVFDEGF